MKEQLVTLEIAKLAKKKGFVEETINSYFETIKHTLDLGRGDIIDFPYHAPRILSSNFRDKYDNLIALAPTQSLLQRWLREVHNIHVQILPYNNKYILSILKTKQNGSNPKFETEYKTYEKALEIGLQKSLKLIKTK